jgi:UDP-N-acetylmuramate--alanine ligase
VLWQTDADRLGLKPADSFLVINEADPQIDLIKLTGLFNRRDAYLVAQAVQELTKEPLSKLLDLLSNFPGIGRRFEKVIDNLYSDYAHTPEKIRGAMNVALETTHSTGQKIVVIYEPLTNRRMHYTRDAHHSVFDGASKIYWVPSYLAREDPNQPVLKPAELIKSLSAQLQSIAEPAELDDKLKASIKGHLASGDLVLALSGGGGGSLDEWLRKEFSSEAESGVA